ncbi:5-formyltetrahydrofolate cyclo-ligase [Ruegeria arenilitoris]|uniref:5-formyltetrahydrofolate cyclo-ligase n=1 Tax=Ruegeria arenilitoris TaxID=1173585 RepID=A0A238KEF6_9RHOB|nr:5-formyltetrahydrofolate cyclo-ligase [Ruegeria arenilitoris]SMX40977.1 5-formyltetrahydrofolate cyclo-ligase family protein [Ruegeria arenilitoris]
MSDDNSDRGGSAPCFQHLIVAGVSIDCEAARDVARFRQAERARLLAQRKMPLQEREHATKTLVAGLESVITPEPGLKIAIYWPIRGEPDLRQWMASINKAGATVLLPVVGGKDQPLEFHKWSPGCEMMRGVWNIPVPKNSCADVPDIVIAPLVGVDESLYRLGNGGGYYDRTLASLDPRPHVIGVGFANCVIKTIFPMPWDVPMDEIVLSDGKSLP